MSISDLFILLLVNSPGLRCYKGLLWTISGGSPSAVALAVTIHNKISLHQNLNERTAFIKRSLTVGEMAAELNSSLLGKWLGSILVQTPYLLADPLAGLRARGTVARVLEGLLVCRLCVSSPYRWCQMLFKVGPAYISTSIVCSYRSTSWPTLVTDLLSVHSVL